MQQKAISKPFRDSPSTVWSHILCNAAETVVPSTLVTHAEFVWERSEEGKTQTEIGNILGWSRDKVAKYDALKELGKNKEAWQIIVTTLDNVVTGGSNDVVTSNVTTVTFTETLLRDILSLEAEQQLDLVRSLATGAIQKGKFKVQAENYKARNEMKAYALARAQSILKEFA